MTVAVTVAVATRNRPDGLVRCLDAILAGTALPAEVLVVDQGDDDRLAQLVGTCEAPTVIRHVHDDRRGLSASRNRAVELATAQVLAVTDDDCVPDRGWVAGIVAAFAADPELAAVTGRVLALGPATAGTYAASLRTSTRARTFTGRAAPWEVGTGANCAIRMSWFDAVGPYDERLGVGAPGRAGEDLDLLYRLLRGGGRVRYDPDVVVLHERSSRADHLARRRSYGFGAGAFCGIWVRRGDAYAVVLAVRWLVPRFRRLAGAVVHRRRDALHEERLYLGAAVVGFACALAGRLHRNVVE